MKGINHKLKKKMESLKELEEKRKRIIEAEEKLREVGIFIEPENDEKGKKDKVEQKIQEEKKRY